MPTPTSAAVIMLTSFAPSPIASVISFGCLYLTKLTSSAFYFGETQQARTAFMLSASFMNSSKSSFLLTILSNASPETIKACLVHLDFTFIFYASISLSITWFDEFPSTTYYSIVLSSNSHEYPILIAVSILSPVKTHTLIPAYFILLMVVETSS